MTLSIKSDSATLANDDFVLSGLCESNLDLVARDLPLLVQQYGLEEVQLWYFGGGFERIVTPDEGTVAFIGSNVARCSRIALRFAIETSDAETPCILNLERWGQRTILNGLVYLDDFSEGSLRELPQVVGHIALTLDASFLGLALEDDPLPLVEGVGLQPPALFIVTVREHLGPVGLNSWKDYGGAVVEWLHPPAGLPSHDLLESSAYMTCRSYLQKAVERGRVH